MTYKLPEGWKEVQLGDLINIKHGYGFKGVDFSKTATDRVLLTPGSFKIGGGYTDLKLRYYREDIDIKDEFILYKDDIIVTMTDLSKKVDTLGYSALIPDNDYIYLHNQRIGLVEVNKEVVEKIYKYYLYWLLRSYNYQRYIANTSTGTTVHHTAPKTILKYQFNIAPLKEQKAIADTLSSLDNKIELNDKTNDNLEQQAQAIFKHWFVDFEFPDKNGNPYKSSGGEMVESELGMIPKGWEVGRLDEIANITMGQSPKGTTYNEIGEGIVFYQGRTDFTRRFPNIRLYTTDPKRIAKQGDMLMSVRAPVGDINIANEECCIGRGLCSLNSKKDMNSYLLYTLFHLKDQYNIYNGEGTVFGSINQKDIKGMQIIKPKEILMKSYNDLTSYLDKRYLLLDQENRNLSQLRDTLLPKLMSGELRISLD